MHERPFKDLYIYIFRTVWLVVFDSLEVQYTVQAALTDTSANIVYMYLSPHNKTLA